MEESIERVADEIIARAVASGTGDFVLDIASPYPCEIICSDDRRAEERVRDGRSLLERHHLERRPGEHRRGTDPVVAFLESGVTLIGIMEELGKYRATIPSMT